MSTTAFGDGLDLASPDSMSPEEKLRFHDFYVRVKGGMLPAHQFLIDFRPDLLKRHRAAAREMTDLVNEEFPLTHTLAHLHFYAVMGFEEGIGYETRQARANGAQKSEILDTLGVAYLHAGPMGMAHVAKVLGDVMHLWQEPAEKPQFPPHWTVDHGAFACGLDFSTQEVRDGEMERLKQWYIDMLGEVPEHVKLLMEYRPRVLKAFRNRFENAIRGSLPAQAVPYFQLHHAVCRGMGDGIRESILLGKAVGLRKSEVIDAICWGMYYGGPNALSLTRRVAGDVLDSY